MILNTFDYDKKRIQKILVKSILKYQLSERLKYVGHAESVSSIEIPFAFMKDIFQTYSLSEHIKPYAKTDYYIMSKNIDIIRIIYPDISISTYAIIQLENEEFINTPANLINQENINQENINHENINQENINDNIIIITRYSITRSMITVFKESIRNSYTNIFYDKYIYKQIITRLCAIYKGFGMYKDITYATLYNSNTVGMLLIEYLKNNKENLIV